MIFNCPGSDRFKKPHPEIVKCPFCGEEVEVWSDEAGASCPKCRRTVSRDGVQCCIDWCSHARECVGVEEYKRYMENKKHRSPAK
jgi:predicted amidophosphoribosyltransferase